MGYDVIDFAGDVCGVDLFPWQRWLLVHMLELLRDGSFRFRNVVVLVARQNGKSTLSQILALWYMYRLGADLVLGTAQDLDTAEEVWQGAVDLVDDVPELRELRSRVVLNNGKKSLELKSGSRYKVKAANRRAGRGLSGDLILLDELREHQSWDAWGSITKTTMARSDAQVVALSNAGDATSVVLRYLRKMAHRSLGDPDGINSADDPSLLLLDDEDQEMGGVDLEDDSLGLFEWSAPPGCDLMDRAGWAQANPALGRSITDRTLASAAKTDPEWVFRTECLCQWSDGSLVGPFPPGAWDAGRVATDSGSAIVGDVHASVEVSWDRSKSSIVFGGFRLDGRPHVEVVAYRAGTEWVRPWLSSPERTVRPVTLTVQPSAPAGSLIAGLVEDGWEVTEWAGSNIGRDCGAFYDAVRGDPDSGDPCGPLIHMAHSVLDVAAATAVTAPLQTGTWVWDRRKSPTDIGPLIGATQVLGAMTRPVDKPFRSRYEDDDAELVMV